MSDIRSWSPEAILLALLSWAGAIAIASGAALAILSFFDCIRRRWGIR